VLEGKVVVVTGAGSGLGRALCHAFHAQGCNVVGIGRTASSLEETGQSLGHERYSFEIADVANAEQVRNAIDNIAERHGRIDYLFNNAAVYNKIGFLDETPEQWAQSIAINVNGPANCCKAALPYMLKNGFGRIFNVGSFADYAPIPESAAYSCSKGAIHALSKGIIADLATHDADIEIHEWTPGHLNTQMSDFTGIDPAISAGWAVGLAQRPPSGRKALLFENDHEVLPPKGLKQRILDKLLFRK
jgi:NAD(P)-dependent dehydrogenase (short-subunit alcohol dehydrogenase family)